MNTYNVVGIERRGTLLLSIILKDSKNLEIYTQESEKVSIAHKKVIWSFDCLLEADNEKNMKLKIAELIESFEEQEIDIELLWELLDESISYTLKELVEIYFSNYTEKDVGSLFVTLSKDKLYFKMNNGLFEKNSATNVEANLQRIAAEKSKKHKENEFLKWFASYHAKQEVPDAFKDLLEKTKLFALHGDRSTNDVKKVGSLLAQTPDELLLSLENKEFIPKNINQTIYRMGLQASFSSEAIKESQRLLMEKINLDNRRVIDDVWNIAIDDQETEEVDDAISFHEENGMYVVGVHIADVDATIKKGSLLDSIAEERFATIYFLDGKIPMFPMDVIKEKLTLAVGCPRATFSGFFYFDEDGNLQKSNFERTVLVLQRRATYEDSLKDLGEDRNFEQLARIAFQIRSERCKNGAVITEFPETKIIIEEDNNKVSFELINANTPAHMVVSEFMIFFNHMLAKTISKRGIPAFYRIQSMNNAVDNLDKNDPLYSIKLRRSLGGATLSSSPGKHATLGLDAYTQGTSPIRRYGDLLIHRQLFYFLDNKSMCYPSDEFKIKILAIEKGEKTIKIAENERYLFWLYKYLKQQKGKVYQGFVNRVFENNRGTVFFPELFHEFSAKLEKESDCKEGKEVWFRIQGASPRKQRLHLLQVPHY